MHFLHTRSDDAVQGVDSNSPTTQLRHCAHLVGSGPLAQPAQVPVRNWFANTLSRTLCTTG